MKGSFIKIVVKVRPNAQRDEIHGWSEGPDGQKVLKIAVTAPPEKGKANKALVNLLAKNLKIPKSDIEIIKGEADRGKLLIIHNFSGPVFDTPA